MLLLGVTNARGANTFTWNGGASGSWNTPGNWQVGGVTQTLLYPGSLSPVVNTDIVIIPTNSGATTSITFTGTHTIASITTSGYNTHGIAIAFSGTTPVLTVTGGISIIQQNGIMVGIAFSGTGTASIGGTCTFGYQQSMTIAAATTVSFTSGSTLDFTNSQGTLTNNGTLNFTGCTLKLGSYCSFVSPGTIIGTSSDFNIAGTPAFITYGGKFAATSCTFEIPSGGYIKSTSTSSAFTAQACTFSMTGSGGAAYFYNNGTFVDHASTYNMSGQGVYLQNAASSIMKLRGTTVNFSASAGNNNQNITNAGTLTIDSLSAVNESSYTSYISNSGTCHLGTSGSQCIVTLSGQNANVTNTGTCDLASTSIIYPTGIYANVTNTSGTFTLRSDASGTAAIGALNSTAGNLAYCSGTFNQERFFQGSTTYDNVKKRWIERNYRIISSPLYGPNQVNSNNVYGLNYIVGATAGLTTTANSATNAFITGCTGGSTSAGNPSTYLYRESYTPSNATFTSGNYLGITNITNSSTTGSISTSDGGTYSIPAGNGVFFFFRGAASNWSTRTSAPYIAPENVTLTSTGAINQQSITVKDWYNSGSTSLGYTGVGTTGNFAVRGFNMVGNPYPCTIDWCTAYSGSGITRTNINPTIWEYNPVTNQFDTFLATSSSGGIANGSASRYIMSGQGFFVQVSGTGTNLLTFTEAAKAATQQSTGTNLLMSTQAPVASVSQVFKLRLLIDSLNYDDIAFNFNSSASSKYNWNEDAAYMAGNSAPEGLASFSDDSVKLSINSLPLPNLAPRMIRLRVEAAVTGTYTFKKMALDAIPKIYQLWLMDKAKNDSLDIRNNSTYVFDVDVNDTTTYGNNRFQLVIRQDPALMIHLLNFTGTKIKGGSQVVWKTENEENYTYFTVERSTDGGVTYNVIGSVPSAALGTYSFLDKSPAQTANMYRLKIVDLNGTASYSNIVTIMYGNNTNSLVKTGLVIYPNPAKSNLSLNIAPGFSTAVAVGGVSYNVEISNILGSVVTKTTINQQTWQTDVSSWLPGTYVIQVVNGTDNSVVGKGTFIKL